MSDSSSPAGSTPRERFDVVVEPDPGVAAQARTAQVSALDLDRLPDRDQVRLLVDADQLARLRAQGLTVRVQRSVPVQPLDPALVATDDDVAAWLAARLGPPAGASGDPAGPATTGGQ